MRAGRFWLAALAAVLFGGGCAAGNGQETVQEGTTREESAPGVQETGQAKRQSVIGELAALTGEEGNWKGLTEKERLADIDFLYETMKENYPYMALAERLSGADWEESYQRCRKKAGEAQTDWQFFAAVQEFVGEGGGLGHLMLLTPGFYQWAQAAYSGISPEGIPPKDYEQVQKIGQAYSNEASRQAYQAMAPVYDRVQQQVEAHNAALEAKEETDKEGAPDQPAASSEPGQEDIALEERGETENLEYGLLEQGTVGYIKVKSFDMAFYDGDRETLFGLYEKYRDCTDVIFDFTENGGGGEGYFNDLILAPNIEHEMSMCAYELVKEGDYNRQFMDLSGYQPIEGLPKLPRTNAEDLGDLDLFQPIEYHVNPSGSGRALKGRLWMLVNENVYSSSEYAAMFAKATGFAALVGHTTGGDGIGMDPIPIVLENSGLIVRYSPVYGLSFDGAGSEECGTEPDIQAQEGESELEACLRAVRGQEGI